MNSSANVSGGIDTLFRSVSQLLGIQRNMTDGLMKLVSSGGDAAMRTLRTATGITAADSCCRQTRSGLPSLTGSCCDIPEPCWMPKCLGEFDCDLCAGASATLVVRITNEDLRPRDIHAVASGPNAQAVSFSPQTLTLGPKERGTITAKFAMPAEGKDDEELEALVWLRGCHDYYVRWTAKTGKHGGCCKHDLSICDGPDNVLHWYDHFYCPRPCRNPGRQPG